MKRIMIVTNSLTGGGAERSMNLVANELWGRGLSVALVPINAGPSDQVVPVCEVFPLQRQWRGGFRETISSLWKFNQIVRSWKPNVIVLNCDLPELFGAFLFSRRKLVVVEHATRPWATRSYFGHLVRWVLRSRATTWVAVSSHLKIWPQKQIPTAILVNSIWNTESNLDLVHHVGKGVQVNRLLFIGRLAREKRPDWVLQISSQTQVPVEVIGDGAMINELTKTAIRDNLNVTFRGQVVNPWSSLKEGDLLIVPSSYEGDGLVVIEALHYRFPMLLADIPDFRRFGFPESNYCLAISDFVRKIEASRNNLCELLVSEELSQSLLKSRSIRMVGDSWVEFLDRF